MWGSMFRHSSDSSSDSGADDRDAAGASEPPASLPVEDDDGRDEVGGARVVYFVSPLLRERLTLRQEPSREIGAKIYPAALGFAKLLEIAAEPSSPKGSDMSPAGDGALSAAGAGAASSEHGGAAATAHGGDGRDALASFMTLFSPTGGWWRGKTVLEVGAGVCGLPGLLLAKLGARVALTDLPSIMPMLSENVAANTSSGGNGHDAAGSPDCVALALSWGGSDVEELRSGLSDAFGCRVPDVIVAADCVYHEHLVDPLLETLIALTEPDTGSGGSSGGGGAGVGSAGSSDISASAAAGDASHASPVILMTYVQRFKRARRFFKKARSHFDISSARLPDVVDYDTLSWDGGDAAPLLTSASADFDREVGDDADADAGAADGTDTDAGAADGVDIDKLDGSAAHSGAASEAAAPLRRHRPTGGPVDDVEPQALHAYVYILRRR